MENKKWKLNRFIEWVEPILTEKYGNKICFKIKAIIKEIILSQNDFISNENS